MFVGIVVAAVVVVGVGPPGELLPRVTVCQLGPEIGTYVILTPHELMNKPFETLVSIAAYYRAWNYTFTSGSLAVGALPPENSSAPISGVSSYGPQGGLAAYWVDNNWTMFRAVNASVIGSASAPCTQPFVAELGATLGCGGGQTLPLSPNNSTDTNEPHILDGYDNITGTQGRGCPVQTPGTYVWFDISFHPNGTGNYAPVDLNLCQGSNWTLQLLGVARIPVVVTVPYQGHNISASGFLNWYGNPTGAFTLGPEPTSWDSAYYVLPGGWNWTLAPVGPAAFPINPNEPLPSLLAFARSAC